MATPSAYRPSVTQPDCWSAATSSGVRGGRIEEDCTAAEDSTAACLEPRCRTIRAHGFRPQLPYRKSPATSRSLSFDRDHAALLRHPRPVRRLALVHRYV